MQGHGRAGPADTGKVPPGWPITVPEAIFDGCWTYASYAVTEVVFRPRSEGRRGGITIALRGMRSAERDMTGETWFGETRPIRARERSG
jgi:hypothetical protein